MHTMSEEKLTYSFVKLTAEAGKVLEAIDDVEEQYVIENPGADVLREQQQTDLDKTTIECEKTRQEL